MIRRKITIHAPQKICFDVVRDFNTYPKFLDSTKSAKERREGDQLLVDFSIQVIKPIRYTLKISEVAPEKLQWELVEGEFMKKNSGTWKFDPKDDVTTEAHYSIDIEFGWLVPKTLVEEITKSQLPDMLQAFKQRAEEIYGDSK